MKRTENMLKLQLNNDEQVPYPDFEQMWRKLEEGGHTTAQSEGTPARVTTRRYRGWHKITLAASIGALLVAAPVYGAIHYDWSNLLQDKGGIQTALNQHKGQSLGQSISRDGVTMTLQTAIVDENRTVILFHLDVGKKADNEFWDVQGLTLGNAKGRGIPGEYSYVQWDEINQRYNGYFETEWTPVSATAKMQLHADMIQSHNEKELEVPLDITSGAVQRFDINKDGMKTLEVQAFKQSGDKLLLSSAVAFSDEESRNGAFPQIVPVQNGIPQSQLQGSSFGAPGEHGEYTMNQYFKQSALLQADTSYKLQYTKVNKTIAGAWDFELNLSKKQMESGTMKTELNVPLEAGNHVNTIEKMVVTPTQIRVVLRTNGQSYADIPYKKITLNVGGRELEGNMFGSPKNDRSATNYRFELPQDLTITKATPVTLVAKYKVTIHEDDKTPLTLTDISDKRQSMIRMTGGYPVKWTYYKLGKDLYVETESEDSRFGGVNQTYTGTGKERILGKPLTVNFSGDGNNKAVDVYRDFKDNEASIYMFYYTTDEPDKETRVQLQP